MSLENIDPNTLELITRMKINAYKERKIYIWGQIDDGDDLVVNRLLEKIVEKDACSGRPLQPVRIYISSPGGSVFAGFSIISTIEQMRESGYEVHTYSFGQCMSAALFIYMAGSHRFSQRHTRFMMHQPLVSGLSVVSAEGTKRLYKDMDELWERMKVIALKYTGVSSEFLDQIAANDQDYSFFADQAVAMGIVDTIL